MTRAQLQSFIVDTLGPIIDAAARTVDMDGRDLASRDLYLEAQLADEKITQAEYDKAMARLNAGRNLHERLKVALDLARHRGVIPAPAPLPNEADHHSENAQRPGVDWAALVGG